MLSWKEILRHHLNPIHVYCRLVDIGISPHSARSISMTYERLVYNQTVLGNKFLDKQNICMEVTHD